MNYITRSTENEEELVTTLNEIEEMENNEKTEVMNRITLIMKDKSIEEEFNRYYINDTRKWFRKGLLLAQLPMILYYFLGIFGFELR